MLKNILNLNGIQKLNKQSQATINGGSSCYDEDFERNCMMSDIPECPNYPTSNMHPCCWIILDPNYCH